MDLLQGFDLSGNIDQSELYRCSVCGLSKKSRYTKVKVTGQGKAGILIITEHPRKQSEPIGGREKRILQNSLLDLEIKLEEDCWVTAACICGSKKGLTFDQITSCRPNMLEVLKQKKPHIVILLGPNAVESYFGDRTEQSMGINKWRGWMIPDHENSCWVTATYSPNYATSERVEPVALKLMSIDFKRAVKHLDIELPEPLDFQNNIKVVDEKDAKKILTKTIRNQPETLTFDYETSGLSPYKKEHFIQCIGIASGGKAHAFHTKNPIVVKKLKTLLRSPIKKIAQNAKFENHWSRQILKATPKNWYWDTQIASHFLDNRTGITNLKFQALVNFGIMDYSSAIDEFLKGTNKKDVNSLNSVHLAPQLELLTYCAKDALITEALYEKQKVVLDGFKNIDGLNLLFDGQMALAEVERGGIFVDVPYIKQAKKDLEEKISELVLKLEEYKEGKLWRELFGDKMNLDSGDQLRDLLYDNLGYETDKKTDSGLASTDKEVLTDINTPFIKDLLLLRKYSKLNGTFLHGILTCQVDGILRPSFSVSTLVSYRSNSFSPNFQNYPSRDPESMVIIKKSFIPTFGNYFGEIDYAGIEVCVAECYHKDPNMYTYICDDSTDMHRDMAMELYLLGEKEWTPLTRYCAKNRYVFPSFYGSYYKQTAKNLWEGIDQLKLTTRDGTGMEKHLKKKGIDNYDDFEDHIQRVDENFWNVKFSKYTEWKEEHMEEYHRNGFFQSLTGFRYQGYMKKNEALNYNIQGSAFHCLLRSLIHFQRILTAGKWKSRIVGQVHDSLVVDINPDELNDFLKLTRKVMIDDLKEDFEWINIPINVEIELSPRNKSWAEKSKVHNYDCSCGSDWAWEIEKQHKCVLCEKMN